MLETRPTRYRRTRIITNEHTPIMVRKCFVDNNDLPHDHDFFEIQLVLGGRGQHWTIHSKQPIKRGDVFILRPGAWHAYRNPKNLEVWVCCIGADLIRRELAWIAHDPALSYLFWNGPQGLSRRGSMKLTLNSTAQAKCVSHLEALEQLTAVDNNQMRPDSIGRLLLLLGELSRAIDVQNRQAQDSEHPVHRAVADAVGLIEGSAAHPWTLDELAHKVHVEKSHLIRLFKAQTGLPPIGYLARHRAEMAAGLLIKTNKNIIQISKDVGWEDPNYFARRFKNHFGCSATSYRTRWRQGAM